MIGQFEFVLTHKKTHTETQIILSKGFERDESMIMLWFKSFELSSI